LWSACGRLFFHIKTVTSALNLARVSKRVRELFFAIWASTVRVKIGGLTESTANNTLYVKARVSTAFFREVKGREGFECEDMWVYRIFPDGKSLKDTPWPSRSNLTTLIAQTKAYKALMAEIQQVEWISRCTRSRPVVKEAKPGQKLAELEEKRSKFVDLWDPVPSATVFAQIQRWRNEGCDQRYTSTRLSLRPTLLSGGKINLWIRSARCHETS
jgi:hypothetical protein